MSGTTTEDLIAGRSRFGGRLYPPRMAKAPDTITIFTVVIVKKHRNIDASEGNSWVCECRCCKLVRERIAKRSGLRKEIEAAIAAGLIIEAAP